MKIIANINKILVINEEEQQFGSVVGHPSSLGAESELSTSPV